MPSLQLNHQLRLLKSDPGPEEPVVLLLQEEILSEDDGDDHDDGDCKELENSILHADCHSELQPLVEHSLVSCWSQSLLVHNSVSFSSTTTQWLDSALPISETDMEQSGRKELENNIGHADSHSELRPIVESSLMDCWSQSSLLHAGVSISSTTTQRLDSTLAISETDMEEFACKELENNIGHADSHSELPPLVEHPLMDCWSLSSLLHSGVSISSTTMEMLDSALTISETDMEEFACKELENNIGHADSHSEFQPLVESSLMGCWSQSSLVHTGVSIVSRTTEMLDSALAISETNMKESIAAADQHTSSSKFETPKNKRLTIVIDNDTPLPAGRKSKCRKVAVQQYVRAEEGEYFPVTPDQRETDDENEKRTRVVTEESFCKQTPIARNKNLITRKRPSSTLPYILGGDQLRSLLKG